MPKPSSPPLLSSFAMAVPACHDTGLHALQRGAGARATGAFVAMAIRC
jgi:hypothetical protein